MNTERPTDEQVRELITATHYSYWMGQYPADLSPWAMDFTVGDGGLLGALGQWLVERARLDTAVEALFQVCVELGADTGPDVSGAQMLARTADIEAMTRWVLDEVRAYRRAADAREQTS